MRGGRSFLILLIVALGLGAYIYFVEMKREPAAEGAEAKKDKVFTVDTGKVQEVQVHSASGETTTLKKEGDAWRITSPEAMDADSTEVSSLVSSLETLEVQRTIDDNPSSVTQFGLDPPRIAVTFKADADNTPHTLQLGSKTPTGGDLYARVEGQPRVFLVSGYLEDTFNKGTFTLREKSVLKFDRDKVDTITVQPAGGKPVTLAKKDSTWRLTEPITAKADSTAVDNIVNRIDQAKMKSVAAADVKDPKQYGLDKPQAVVTFGAGSTRASLAIGAKTEADATAVYARDLSRPMVFTVDATLLDDLKKQPDDLRARDVFAFRSFNATSVDFTWNGQGVTYAKEKPAGTDQSSAVETWKQTKPAPKDLDQTKATDLLTTLSNLRANSFTDKPLASGDTLEVVARYNDGGTTREERVTLRKSGDVVQAIVPDEPGAMVVTTADFDKVVATLKELSGLK